MGFLKKSSAPSELPDLAMGYNSNSGAIPVKPLPVREDVAPQVVSKPEVKVVVEEEVKAPVAGEDFLEVSHEEAVRKSRENETKKILEKDVLDEDNEKLSRAGFFDQVLEDINGELKDLGKLEDWYEKKFVKENVVSNMKGYWEGNKADIIIESFGAEYKRQINEKVRVLQNLEEDWREIYFKLVKKEEEMKKEERELKETVAEFVELCKRRKVGGEEKVGKKK